MEIWRFPKEIIKGKGKKGSLLYEVTEHSSVVSITPLRRNFTIIIDTSEKPVFLTPLWQTFPVTLTPGMHKRFLNISGFQKKKKNDNDAIIRYRKIIL
jgi:hypothetical protein